MKQRKADVPLEWRNVHADGVDGVVGKMGDNFSGLRPPCACTVAIPELVEG